MPVRAITRAVRGGATVIVAGALVAGLGAGSAEADEVDAPTADGSTAEGLVPSSAETTSVRLKVGTRDVERLETEAQRPVGLLEEAGVSVDRNDEVGVRRDGRTVRSHDNRVLRDGDLVKVVRVKHRVKVRTNRFEHHTRKRTTTSLAPGKRKVAQRGRDGIRRIRVHLELRNGRIADRDVRKSWQRRPQPKVILVGKRYPTVAGTSHLNWGALARCESGGNPRAVNPSGYYGLYQFNVGTWRSVGGAGMPHQAAPAEQTYRAQRLYSSRGRSPWPHCGRYL